MPGVPFFFCLLISSCSSLVAHLDGAVSHKRGREATIEDFGSFRFALDRRQAPMLYRSGSLKRFSYDLVALPVLMPRGLTRTRSVAFSGSL